MDVFCTKTDSDKRGFNVKEPFQSLSMHLPRLVLTDKQVKYYEWLTAQKQIQRWGALKEQLLPLLVGLFFLMVVAVTGFTARSWEDHYFFTQSSSVLAPALPIASQPKETKNSYAGIPEVVSRLFELGCCSLNIPVVWKRKTGWQKTKIDVKTAAEQRKQQIAEDSLSFSCPISITAW